MHWTLEGPIHLQYLNAVVGSFVFSLHYSAPDGDLRS